MLPPLAKQDILRRRLHPFPPFSFFERRKKTFLGVSPSFAQEEEEEEEEEEEGVDGVAKPLFPPPPPPPRFFKGKNRELHLVRFTAAAAAAAAAAAETPI